MRIILSTGIIAAAILIYFMLGSPQEKAPKDPLPTQTEPVKKMKSSVVATPDVNPTSAPTPVPESNPTKMPETAPVTESPVESENQRETGPFELNFGQHTVHFAQDRGQAMQFRLVLTVPDRTSRAIVLRKKWELTQTLYFHGSARRAEAMDVSGRDRLIDYVEPIFQRLVKNDQIQVEMRDFERVEVTFPDAGTP